MIRVREGGPADSGAAWRLYRRAILEGAGAHYTEAERRAWAGAEAEPAWMADRIAAGRIWLAGRGRAAEGFLVAAGLGAEGPAHLDLFFVAPEARGTGVAAALHDRFAAAAAQAGQGRLTTFASLHLRPFLERRGWRVVRADPAERGGAVLMRFVMECDLRGDGF